MDEPPTVGPFARQKIDELAEDVLREAGVIDVLPTPVDALAAAVGVRQRIDISALPADLEARKPAGWGRLLGAVMIEERTMFIDDTQPEARRRFTEAHEIAHLMCGWHHAAVLVETESTLFQAGQEAIEVEANYGAGRLLFQGDRFHRRVEGERPSIAVALELARVYGTSRHSTMHYYVDGHAESVALLIAGRYPDALGRLPVWRTVESATFRSRFGPLAVQLASGRPATLEAIGDILADAHRSAHPTVDVTLTEEHGEAAAFRAEAYYNRRCHFVLLAERPVAMAGSAPPAQRWGVA